MLACPDELITRVVLVYLDRHLFTGAGVAHRELMVYPDCFPCQQTNRYGVSGGIADAFDDCCIHAPPLLIRAESKPVNVAGGRQFYLPPRNDTENPVIIIVVCDHLRSASVSLWTNPGTELISTCHRSKGCSGTTCVTSTWTSVALTKLVIRALLPSSHTIARPTSAAWKNAADAVTVAPDWLAVMLPLRSLISGMPPGKLISSINRVGDGTPAIRSKPASVIMFGCQSPPQTSSPVSALIAGTRSPVSMSINVMRARLLTLICAVFPIIS